MFKIKEIRIPLYKGVLAFCISNEKEKIIEYFNLDGLFKEDEQIYSHAFYTWKDYIFKKTSIFLIVFNFESEFPITYGTLMHEINHMGNFIFDHFNIEPNYKNDEAETYLKEWIANELFQFLDEMNLLKKIKIGQIKYLE